MRYINKPMLKFILESDSHNIIYENFDRKELLVILHEMDSMYRQLFKKYKIMESLDDLKK